MRRTLRAPRFPLHLAVRYKRVADDEWRRGETENISHSGVLLRAADAIAVDTIVELRLRLAIATPERDAAEVSCLGRVVRTVPPCPERSWPGSAVAIERYDFLPPHTDVAIEPHP